MGDDVQRRVRTVLETATEPLSVGRIQRRIAEEGLDVATGAIRDACDELVDAGEAEAVGDPPRQQYRIRG